MKKLLSLSVVIIMFVVAFVTTSCSTAKSINKAFEKNGYVMTSLTPQQQAELAPIVSAFPAFNQTAVGYIQADAKSITFVYQVDEAVWNSYGNVLSNAGFSNMGVGFVKADKAKGITYNISSKSTAVYKQPYLLVTYTYAAF